VVALLTPLVFAPLAGAISVLVARYGLNIDSSSLQAIFITGATVAFGKSALWLKGWQDHERRAEEPAGLPGATADLEPDLEPDPDAFAFDAVE
jgi:hypothetical protein